MSEPTQAVFLNKKKSAQDSSKGNPLAAKGLIRKNVNKRWLFVLGGAVAVIGILSVAAAPEKAGPRKREAPTSRISVTPPQADKVNFEAQYLKDLTRLSEEVKSLKKDKDTLVNSMSVMRAEMDEQEKARKNEERLSAKNPGGQGQVVSPPTVNGGGLSVIGGNAGGPPPPPIPLTGVPTTPNGAFVPPTLGGNPAANLPTAGGIPTYPAAPAKRSIAPVVYDAPEGESVEDAPADEAAKAAAAAAAKAKAKNLKKNSYAGQLPAGPFAPVSLLHGLEAGTSSSTQSNPMPVLLNIQENAVMPGNASYKLRNCFVLGNGYGDLSSERVYVRLNRISCVDKKDRMVLSQEVQGYLVDSDGKLGMRGIIYDRQGAALGKSMLAGFAQGLASALGSAQSTVSSNLTTGLTSSSISGGAAIRASGLQGAQQATAQLADFYLKEAQNIFPVIGIDAGRTATLVFSGPVTLEWKSAEERYVADDKPQ